MTPYGKLVETLALAPTARTEPVVVGIQNPRAFLHAAVRSCGPFAQLMMRTLREKPPPWSIILYSDGISPSDTLTKVDRRKLVAVYWSFLELGCDVLSTEEGWFVAATIRQSLLRTIDGGLSSLLRALLESYFFPDERGFNNSGVGLEIEGFGLVKLTAGLEVLLADEPALQEMAMFKGHSGFKPCPLCMNVILPRHMDPELHQGVPMCSLRYEDFEVHTNATVRAPLAKLKELRV